MGHTFSVKNNLENNKPIDQTVEVLYQKMGDRWYAFSLIDDEVFFGTIPEKEINEAESSGRKHKMANT